MYVLDFVVNVGVVIEGVVCYFLLGDENEICEFINEVIGCIEEWVGVLLKLVFV